MEDLRPHFAQSALCLEDRVDPKRGLGASERLQFLLDERTLREMGSEILHGPEHGQGGSFMIVKHPDGLVVEYIDQAR